LKRECEVAELEGCKLWKVVKFGSLIGKIVQVERLGRVAKIREWVKPKSTGKARRVDWY
jgi:hypothetical protein